MSDITLPRAEAEQIRQALASGKRLFAALAALDAALAEPERHVSLVCPQCNWTLQEPEPDAKPEPVHPGYVIGSHWLETAYSRIAAGEAEDAVLAEVLGERWWAKREPATVEQVIAAHGPSWGPSATPDFFTGFRAAERHHGIRKEDK